jgi:hypothetical protein
MKYDFLAWMGIIQKRYQSWTRVAEIIEGEAIFK